MGVDEAMLTVDADAPVRKKAVDYSSKTRKWLKARGYLIANVEKYEVYSNRKNDCFGFIDYLCIKGPDTVGVQACGRDFAPHIEKMTKLRRSLVIAWLTGSTRRVLLIGWRKLKGKYVERVAEFYLEEGELRWKETLK